MDLRGQSDYVTNVINKSEANMSVEVDAAKDELQLIYRHWEEGRKKETTLIVTGVLDDYVD